MNHEGYKDPKAEKAIKNYNRAPYHVRTALYHLNAMASLLGFEIVRVRDKRTGRELEIELGRK